MDEKKINYTLGAWLAIIGAVLGIALNYAFFMALYQPLMAAIFDKSGVGSLMVIKFLLPAFTDVGIIAGILYAISAIGFFKKAKWAYVLAVTANVLALWTSFWPMIPVLDVIGVGYTELTPLHIFIFFPNIILYFLLNGTTGKRNLGRLVVGLLTGMAFIMAFIDGTASLNIGYMKGLGLVEGDNSLYVMANRLFWLAAFGYGIITVGIMCFPKEWIRMLGIGSAIICMLFGFPMGIITTLAKGEISMYLGAPVISVVLIVIFLIPSLWNKIMKLEEVKEE